MGSLTKAGKVRDQTWKQKGIVDRAKYHERQRKSRKKSMPRTKNAKKYYNRFVLGHSSGQRRRS